VLEQFVIREEDSSLGSLAVADPRILRRAQVVDATRLPEGEPVTVGWLGELGMAMERRFLVRVLMEAGIIRTYAHIESKVVLEREVLGDGTWEGWYSGEHVYFTNSRNTGTYRIVMRVAPDGRVTAGRAE